MERLEINETYQNICTFSTEKQLMKAIELLEKQIEKTNIHDFKIALEREKTTYQYLLKYNIDGVEDPQRQKVYMNLVKSILLLNDKVKEFLYEKSNDAIRLGLNVYKKNAQSNNGIFLKEALIRLIEEKEVRNLDNLREELFIQFWMNDLLKDYQIDFCKQINTSKEVAWVDKSLIVTSLTLSLFRFFDLKKLHLLIDFFESGEHQVWQRALTGLIVSMHLYNKRIDLYPELYARLEVNENFDKFKDGVKAIAIQLIRTLDTEQIQKVIKDEILPEVTKITPKIINKLDLDNILGENLYDEDKNPDWENVFSDSPDLLEKMGQLSQMQLEGTDVFMGTFSQLKNFDFFKKQHNWFIPFFDDNPIVQEMFEGEEFDTSKFLNTFSKVPFFCNSDKYSFCLNLKHVPSTQKNMMASLFMSELQSMQEIGDDDKLLQKGAEDKFVFTQYIQDIYRFFKLNPLKDIYDDIFSQKLDLYNSAFYNELLKKEELTKDIASFYFEKSHYPEALNAYKKLLTSGQGDYEIFQKIAFSYQKLKDFKNAVKFYVKAELFDQNKAWNLKKIGFCYLKLEQAEKALKYYQQAEKLEPDNLKIQANLGRCHIALENYEEALKYYYKVEYLAPENTKVQRPLAWCLFIQGKFDKAKKYLEKIIEREPLPHDYLNLGHVEFCSANKNEAAKHYKQSIKAFNNSNDTFENEFNNDLEVLKKHGIDENELFLLFDYLRF